MTEVIDLPADTPSQVYIKLSAWNVGVREFAEECFGLKEAGPRKSWISELTWFYLYAVSFARRYYFLCLRQSRVYMSRILFRTWRATMNKSDASPMLTSHECINVTYVSFA